MLAALDYRLSDFLLFAPQTYFRLFEHLHEDFLWLNLGMHAGLLAIAAAVAARRAPAVLARLVPLLLAAAWAWSSFAFVWQLYLPINWAIRFALPLLGLQVLLCALLALRPPVWLPPHRPLDAQRIAGWLLLAVALAYPTLAPLSGRGWTAAELFGSAPDATAIGTLGFILLLHGRQRWALLPVPALWCTLSTLVLLAMEATLAWLPLAAAALATAAAITHGVSHHHSPRSRRPAPPHPDQR